jgi:predicted acylesterase/phospholipase RssA
MKTTALHQPRSLAKRGASSPRTAFVLSGGASLSAVQVGMLQALYEQGIAPDFLVGTSAGALNAAFVASRPQVPTTARRLGRIWRDLQRGDIFPVRMTALAVVYADDVTTWCQTVVCVGSSAATSSSRISSTR